MWLYTWWWGQVGLQRACNWYLSSGVGKGYDVWVGARSPAAVVPGWHHSFIHSFNEVTSLNVVPLLLLFRVLQDVWLGSFNKRCFLFSLVMPAVVTTIMTKLINSRLTLWECCTWLTAHTSSVNKHSVQPDCRWIHRHQFMKCYEIKTFKRHHFILWQNTKRMYARTMLRIQRSRACLQ